MTANNERAAAEKAFELISAELAPRSCDLQAEEIVELASFEGVKLAGKGFSFFPEDIQ